MFAPSFAKNEFADEQASSMEQIKCPPTGSNTESSNSASVLSF